MHDAERHLLVGIVQEDGFLRSILPLFQSILCRFRYSIESAEL
jgi:hypothetical protein